AAHALGVIHRDIKPENLIVDPTGQLKIMDFGIARALHAGGAAAEGGLSGTPGYLAPEQLVGQTGDARSDIYAVGVVLYEALGGRRPFLAVDINELAYRVANEAPPPLGEVAPEVRPEVARLVMRCLARDPAARPADAATLERELGELRA
ncbi:MAG: serine/threonine protein kinase, partial [Candidatus Eisenbacteria bacterium]